MAKIDTSRMIKKAEEALNRRNYGLAIFNYMQALALEPENVDARIKLRATQARSANESGGASSVKMLPPLIKAHILKILGKSEQAILSAEQALTANPNSVGAMKLLAGAAEKAELIEVAAWQRQEIADKYDQEDTDNLWELVELYCNLDRPQEALNSLEKIKEIDPDEDVDGEMRDIQARLTSSTYAQGVQEGSHAIIKDEEERQILEMDSNKLRTDEQRRQYINYRLEHDAKERPDDHRVFLGLADVCHFMDDFETGYKEGMGYLEKARELNPTDNTTLDKIGDFEIKKLRGDLKTLQTAIKADAKNQDLRKQFKEKRKALLDYETQEFQRRVKAQPLKANFHSRLGELFFQAKRYDEAIGELQQAAKDPKFKIGALTTMGRSFHEQKQYDLAIDQFRRAREGQELYEKVREPTYFEAQSFEAKYHENPAAGTEPLTKALELYTYIYQIEINFKDVKQKVPELQQIIRDAQK